MDEPASDTAWSGLSPLCAMDSDASWFAAIAPAPGANTRLSVQFPPADTSLVQPDTVNFSDAVPVIDKPSIARAAEPVLVTVKFCACVSVGCAANESAERCRVSVPFAGGGAGGGVSAGEGVGAAEDADSPGVCIRSW